MNKSVINEIESLAYRYLSREEISAVTETELSDLRDKEHPHYRAFIKGRLLRKAEFNHSLIQLSKQLSSPAMAIEYKIAEQTHLNDLKTR